MDPYIQELFSEATRAIQALEDAIRKTHRTPYENIDYTQYKKIRIPSNYVRSKQYFIQSYKLSELIGKNRFLFNNVAYALQLTDLYNYLINRLEIYGVIKNLILKNGIINVFSIIEGILYQVVLDLGFHCQFSTGQKCPNFQKCRSFVNYSKNLKASKLEEILETKLNLSSEFLSGYGSILAIRNFVHMQLVEFSEYFDTTNYTLEKYNESITLLTYIKDNLINQVSQFLKERESICIKQDILSIPNYPSK